MTSYNVTGLEEFTNYTFIVSAVNQIGKGPTVLIFEQTLPDSKFKIHLNGFVIRFLLLVLR